MSRLRKPQLLAASSANFNKMLFVIHGWSGIVLGLLLYAVIVTGAGAVFTKEISNWSSPLPYYSEDTFQSGLDKILRDLIGVRF